MISLDPVLLLATSTVALQMLSAQRPEHRAIHEQMFTAALRPRQSPGFTLQPLAGRNTTIWSVRDSGDLNGDGLDDVVASAPAACGGTAYLYVSSVAGPSPLTTRIAFQTPVPGTAEFGWSAAIGPGSHLIFVSDTLTTVGSSFQYNGQVYVFKLN